MLLAGMDALGAELLPWQKMPGAPFSVMDEVLPHLDEQERRDLARQSPALETAEAASELAGKAAQFGWPTWRGPDHGLFANASPLGQAVIT